MAVSVVPAAGWMAAYERPWLKADVLAGLTTAAVVIPKAMAYAAIAGLPVQIGLYTALVPMVVYAALGTSRVLSVSTTTTLAILTASALAAAVPEADPAGLLRASATLALLVGAILLLARLLRLGFVANFISEPVLTGFKAGIGLVIVVDQAPKLLGLHYDRAGWFRDVASFVRHAPEASAVTVAVGLPLVSGGDEPVAADFANPVRVGVLSGRTAPSTDEAVAAALVDAVDQVADGTYGRLQGEVFNHESLAAVLFEPAAGTSGPPGQVFVNLQPASMSGEGTVPGATRTLL